MSFSAGFRDGFDLVNDVKDREVAQRRLDEQARQGDLDRETQTQRYNLDREATADYRQGQLDNTAEGNRIQGVTAEAKLLEAKNRETQLGQDENIKHISGRAISILKLPLIVLRLILK